MKRLLLFAMAIIFAMQLSAQTTFVVGDTTTSTTSNYYPIYWYYGASFSESIYPASELAPGLIQVLVIIIKEALSLMEPLLFI